MEEEKIEKEVVKVEEESLQVKLAETAAILKRKIVALRERNEALVAKCKEQAVMLKTKTVALSAKPKQVSMSLVGKVKATMDKVRRKPRILVVETDGTVFALRGAISTGRDGLVRVVDAEIGEFDINTNQFKKNDNAYAGTCYICQENIAFIVMA